MNNTRNILIAVALSFIGIMGWQQFSKYMGWVPDPVAVRQAEPQQQSGAGGAPDATAPQNIQPQQPAQANAPAFVPTPGQDVVVETPMYKAVFNSNGGVLKNFELKNFATTSEETRQPTSDPVRLIKPKAANYAPMGIEFNGQPTWASAQWSYTDAEEFNVKNGESASVVFTGEGNGVRIKRTFSFDSTTYVLREKLEIVSSVPQIASISFNLSATDLAGPEEYQRVNRAAWVSGNKFDTEDDLKDIAAGDVTRENYRDLSWAGVMGTYFITAMLPSDNAMTLDVKAPGDDVFKVSLKKSEVPLQPDQPFSAEMSYYLGPKHVQALESAGHNLEESLDYGWFGLIAKPLLALLKIFYSFVDNYGVAIILLTVLIKIVLWPLSYKSYKSMESMKKLQPIMAKIREKYKDDKERMNKEMMQLYKTYKINPMGGCLPIVVQLPIFIGLYRALLSAFELRQASFIPTLPFTDIVWLSDLSLKDPLYITPLVMGATMLLMQKMTPSVGDPTQAKIMMLLPVVFTFMFINFPSGLVLYWLMNNIISMGQQYWQLRLKKTK